MSMPTETCAEIFEEPQDEIVVDLDDAPLLDGSVADTHTPPIRDVATTSVQALCRTVRGVEPDRDHHPVATCPDEPYGPAQRLPIPPR